MIATHTIGITRDSVHAVLDMFVEEVLGRYAGAACVLGLHGIDICRTYPLALRTAARIVGADPHRVGQAILQGHASSSGVTVETRLLNTVLTLS